MNPHEPAPQRDDFSLPATLAMSAPPIRMVVLAVYALRHQDAAWIETRGEWEENDCYFYPVLGIVATQEHRFTRLYREGARLTPPTPSAEFLIEDGWQYVNGSGNRIASDVVVLDPETRGLNTASQAFDADNVAHAIVVTPWPETEDATRLAALAEELRREARSKAVLAEQHPEPE